MMLTFRAVGDWDREQVRVVRAERSSRRIVPEVERIIDETWAFASSRPGVNLFDGPVCRLDALEASAHELRLTVSTTSYKPAIGTNLHNAHLADTYGHDVLANPIGVSALLETADGYWMLGQRNDSVAYYPNRVHPFAGAYEPKDGLTPFTTAYRELYEEAGIEREELIDMRCLGIVEDRLIRQPELICFARTRLLHKEVSGRVDDEEHHASWAVALDENEVERTVAHAKLTPVARGALMLAGRGRFGVKWFERVRQVAPGELGG